MLLKECRRCKTLVSYPKTCCDICKEVIDKEKEEARLKYRKINYNFINAYQGVPILQSGLYEIIFQLKDTDGQKNEIIETYSFIVEE